MAHHDSGEQIGGGALLLLAAAAALALSAALFGSLVHALVFWAALALFASPGLPIARRSFSGATAWLAGGALGYFGSSLLASVLARLGLASPAAVLLAPGALYLFGRLAAGRGPRAAPSSEAAGDRPWLAFSLLFVVGLTALPFLHVGTEVPGGFAYRAYFSADLMTHLSVVGELQKGAFPPENPFYAGEPLGYYWLVFLFPAALGRWTSNQGALLGLYLASGFLFAGLLFHAGRRLGLSGSRAFLLTVVAIGAVGYDGLFALVGREPWTDMNVDAFARWVFGLTSLDGLQRAVLYTPQHLFSYSLLVVLILLVVDGEPRTARSASLAGVLLGAMAGASIVTAMLAGPWLVLVLFLRRTSLRSFLSLSAGRHRRLARLSRLVRRGGLFRWRGRGLHAETPSPRRAPLPALRRLRRARAPRRLSRESTTAAELPLALLAGLALLAVLFLDLKGYEGVWMAWRAGSVLLVALALLAAPALSGRLRPFPALVILPAALTLFLDVYNAQDVTNRRLSAGAFRWTTVVSAEERDALEWLKRETPENAVVQWDVRARELGEWALVPALAERRMAVGFPIFLLDLQKYRARERRQVRPIFAAGDADEAHRLATELGIDYLFIGATELRTRGERLRELFEAPLLFRRRLREPERHHFGSASSLNIYWRPSA